ncbi:Two-component response regulator [Croceitalea dokdonensis DOKDO 023]|uniref:Two-component response regulator n=1 Tax=Croceitalea dokdonensis DOKDO 023 TaxID=1300341 RepID=A0A0N8H3Y1_9FLAO|nr:response regulator [Croceitalea dokdonensis]KPM31836.1 Two-component response regulator [Croceitalea dokdonensis DOKDO 023]
MKINKVYIIDDDLITQFGIKKLLSRVDPDCEVLQFENGKTALSGILADMEKDALPNVLFLDINMPIMDGWQFLEELVKLPIAQKLLINILTSSIDKYDQMKWKEYKMKSHHIIKYDNKPIYQIDIEQLLSVNIAS